MLSDPDLAISFRDVCFNGYEHLQDADIEVFGGPQGEALTELSRRPGTRWNRRSDDRLGGSRALGGPGDHVVPMIRDRGPVGRGTSRRKR
jgi:hypothetical protein